MQELTFQTCQIRDNNFGRTLTNDNIKIKPAVQYPYTWVQIEETPEYDTELFCIYIDGAWHQAQSIDFNF